MIKTMQEFKEKTKGLSQEKANEFLNNLSEEEQELIKQEIIKQQKINYVFKDDDFMDYTEEEEELKTRIDILEETIKGYKQSELWYKKDSILNPFILEILAHCIKDTERDLGTERLNDLISRYNSINDFINTDENQEKILMYYGNIVYKDENGFYEVNDAIANKILAINEFKVSDRELDDIKDAINMTWENKKEILDPNEINTLSEKQNGINFKEFLFCEEYLKRGKIKPTCDYLGISRNTAYIWLKDNKVQAYLKNRQEEIKKETDDTFMQTYRASFNQLNKMINSKGIDTTDKIKAIDIFLKHYENIERLKQDTTISE